MRLQTFQARTAREAIDQVRRSLGEDAVIVLTQDLPQGGVRVTAATESEDEDLAALLAPAEPRPLEAALGRALSLQETPPALAERLLALIREAGIGEPVAALAQALRQTLVFRPIAPEPSRPLMLFGPAGAGKTACVAKLAARAVLAGRPVRVLSCDGERAGGIAQLQALLAPLGQCLEVAAGSGELRERLRGQDGAALVVIDTGGVNPFRGSELARITAQAEAAGAEALAVLPAGLGSADSAEIARNLKAVGAERMIVTRLDAARRLGGLLAAAGQGLAIAEVAIGPVIGQGLAALSPTALARLLLRGEDMPRTP
jgi:flagellar biosynthesis protein FlhF